MNKKNLDLISKFVTILTICLGFAYGSQKTSAEEINQNFDFLQSAQYKFSFDSKIKFNPSRTSDLLLSKNIDNSQTEENLAAEAQNPIANLISVPFQNNTNFGVGQYDRTQNIFNIQPVVPVSLNEDWLVVTRTIVPIVYQPATGPANSSSHFGLGDITPQFFFVPKTKGHLTWGVGPVFLLPTATDDSLGTGKWGIGPTGVVVWSKDRWVIGALANNIWSVAGDSDRRDVNQLLVQPFVNYNLDNGWYILSAPIITANWQANSGNQWLVPIGGGVGKLFNIGKQPINASLQAYLNAEKPKHGPEWTARFQFQLLFPKN